MIINVADVPDTQCLHLHKLESNKCAASVQFLQANLSIKILFYFLFYSISLHFHNHANIFLLSAYSECRIWSGGVAAVLSSSFPPVPQSQLCSSPWRGGGWSDVGRRGLAEL